MNRKERVRDAEPQALDDHVVPYFRLCRSELVRDAVRRQVALLRFEEARRALLPLAEAQGILTDEDVFTIVS